MNTAKLVVIVGLSLLVSLAYADRLFPKYDQLDPELHELSQYLADNLPYKPYQYHRLNEKSYLVFVSDAPLVSGIYLVDTGQRRLEHVLRGFVSPKEVRFTEDGGIWMLFRSGRARRGIYSWSLAVFVVSVESGQVRWKYSRLASGMRDAVGGGGSDDCYRAESIGMTESSALKSFNVENSDGNSTPDVRVYVEVQDCKSGDEASYEKLFQFDGANFKEIDVPPA